MSKIISPYIEASFDHVTMDKEQHASWTGLGLSERKTLLFLIDVFMLNGALFIGLIQQGHSIWRIESAWNSLPFLLILTVLWVVFSILFGVYNLVIASNMLRSMQRSGIAAGLTIILFLFLPITPALENSRFPILNFPVLATVGILSWRIFYATIIAQPRFFHRILLVGAGHSGAVLAKALKFGDNADRNIIRNIGYEIIGFLDDDPAKHDTYIENSPVLGRLKDVNDLVRKWKPDQVVLCITDPKVINTEIVAAILAARTLGVQITTMAALYEHITGRVPVEHVGHNINALVQLNRFAFFNLYMAVRRIMDILFGLQGCLLVALVIPIVWIANRIYSPGPLFYRQERVGIAGKTFDIIKFRSMITDAEKFTGAVWADNDDPRITKIGRFLRLTRLDEIPQFWNILNGEMSLIGPRPERPHFVDLLSKEIPFYQTRHAIKPGLTGWAQVIYRYGASTEDALMKLQYDLYYIKHQGAFLDLKIVLKTFGVVLGFKGR